MITWVAPDYQLSHPQNQAILNAMFTVGAFVTPMLIATSMHNMRGAVWPAYYILAGAAIVEAAFLPQLPSPDPIRHPVAGERVGDGARRRGGAWRARGRRVRRRVRRRAHCAVPTPLPATFLRRRARRAHSCDEEQGQGARRALQ